MLHDVLPAQRVTLYRKRHLAFLVSPWDSIKSLLISLRFSKHLRNMVVASAVMAYASHRAGKQVFGISTYRGRNRWFAHYNMFFIIFWIIYHRYRVRERAQLRYRRTSWNMHILERFKLRTFNPVWWAFNTHAQTVVCNSINALESVLRPFARYTREEVRYSAIVRAFRSLPSRSTLSMVTKFVSTGPSNWQAHQCYLQMHLLS